MYGIRRSASRRLQRTVSSASICVSKTGKVTTLTGVSWGIERPHQPVDEYADARRQLAVARIEQRDRRRRGWAVRQYSDKRPSFQIVLNVIARHLNQSQTEPRRGDETLGAVD